MDAFDVLWTEKRILDVHCIRVRKNVVALKALRIRGSQKEEAAKSFHADRSPSPTSYRALHRKWQTLSRALPSDADKRTMDKVSSRYNTEVQSLEPDVRMYSTSLTAVTELFFYILSSFINKCIIH